MIGSSRSGGGNIVHRLIGRIDRTVFVLLSPAKKMAPRPLPEEFTASDPAFLSHTAELLAELRPRSPHELADLMRMSTSLAQLNHERYQKMILPAPEAAGVAAGFLFAGDVYAALNFAELPTESQRHAGDHLGILSGFYGLVRPFDRILPYRLEMGTRLTNRRGKDLYAFWGDYLTQWLSSWQEQHPNEWVVNLASREYARAARIDRLTGPWVEPVFKEIRDGKPRVIGVLAKRARGRMARFILENCLTNATELQAFNWQGYTYQSELSQENQWVYTRESGG